MAQAAKKPTVPADRTIAVLGGGQLGRMLGLAAIPLGLRCRFLDPDPDAPARDVGELIVGAYDDEAKLAQLIAGTGVVTYEFENVPASAARWLADHAEVRPGPAALEASQDRLVERETFRKLGIDTPRWWRVDSAADLEAASRELGGPGILKTRRFGYDGKGQQRVGGPGGPGEAAEAFGAIGGVPAVLDEMIAFDRELSVVAARSVDGETRCCPIAENVHDGGILRRSVAPAAAGPELAREACDAAATLAESLGYVGVLAVEFFDVGGRLLVNEFAPRVHNTGHWTIEGAVTSQFENHVRAVCGLPLGETAARGRSAMVNIIGDVPDAARRAGLLALPGVHLHLYGKDSREGRKVGHVTIELGESRLIREVERLLESAGARAG